MKEKKISIEKLEDCLCDGIKIDEMLGSGFDLLRVDELEQSYTREDDIRLNNDFRDYYKREEEKERQRIRQQEGY
ncbi:hypothetical protein [Alistipes putredinis]|uniref:hypothetical protein n=1 Tax=Alistipes putredinis TaxID=28117 RepID=UPI003AB310E1